MNYLISFLLTFISISSSFANLKKLDIVYKWKYIDFVWPSEELKNSAISNGDYNYKNIIPMGFAKAPGKEIS